MTSESHNSVMDSEKDICNVKYHGLTMDDKTLCCPELEMEMVALPAS